MLTTDTQKNTVFAFARDGIGEIEDFGLRLARHFVNEFESVHTARVTIEEFAWHRLHDHAFERAGAEKRTCVVTVTREQAWVVGGISDLVLLKTTDSEFHGYIKDRYTTLAETSDRIMATSVDARWRFGVTDFVDGGGFAKTKPTERPSRERAQQDSEPLAPSVARRGASRRTVGHRAFARSEKSGPRGPRYLRSQSAESN